VTRILVSGPVAGAIVWLIVGVTALAAARGVAGHRRARAMRTRLAAAGPPVSGVSVRRVSELAVFGAAAVLVAAWLAVGPGTAVALAALGIGAPVGARIRSARERRRSRDAQLPVALDRLAASLRSGASLTLALGDAGAALDPPLGPELTRVAGAAGRGVPLSEALDGWTAAHDDPGTRLAATALALATVVGSGPARALDGVATTVRERLDLAAERRALATQARTSSLVLSLAPPVFAALLVTADSAAARFLLGTPAGWACLGIGIALDAAGIWWMMRLSRSEGW
jgi:tight adherence protein B